MPTLTISVMGKKEGENLMRVIMQTVRDTGKYELEIKERSEPRDLMAHKMVQYKILNSTIERNFPRKADCYVFTMGDNFAAANLKGAHKFIAEEDKRLNPNSIKKFFSHIDRSNIISAVIGGLLVWLVTLIFG